jgi:excinuclease UvrABC helicase subunit UvrB
LFGCSRRGRVARLKKLEPQTHKHAQNLEVEDAARERDEVKCVRDAALRA